MNRIIALVVVIVLLLFAASSTVFVVDQRHMAVLTGRGDAAPELLGPGLHARLPPPLQTLVLIDSRIQTLDTPDEDRYVTSDKTDLLVDPVIKFRVTDPLKLFAQTKGDDQSLPDRLALLSRSALGDAFAKVTLADALGKQQALLADAYMQAQTIKGEGDGKAASIAADAYGRDPQFYEFYQSMLAYRNTFKPNDVIVVDSSSEFFRFMRSPNGDASPDAVAAPRKH